MRIKLIAISVLAFGMATSAFAQSNPAPAGATMDKNTMDSGGGANGDMKKPMTTDMNSTSSTMNNGSATNGMTNCKGSDAANATGSGAVQTQGGNSNATTQDQACAQ
jgi:hypothetical protein